MAVSPRETLKAPTCMCLPLQHLSCLVKIYMALLSTTLLTTMPSQLMQMLTRIVSPGGLRIKKNKCLFCASAQTQVSVSRIRCINKLTDKSHVRIFAATGHAICRPAVTAGGGPYSRTIGESNNLDEGPTTETWSQEQEFCKIRQR